MRFAGAASSKKNDIPVLLNKMGLSEIPKGLSG